MEMVVMVAVESGHAMDFRFTFDCDSKPETLQI